MSDNEYVQVDQQVVEQLTNVADTMTAMLSKMMESQEGQSKDLDIFRAELSEVRNSIQRIAKVLHEGNGEKPVIARLAVLETQMNEALLDIRRLEKHEEDRAKAERERKSIDSKGKYAVIAAVVSGALALATTIISTWG